MDRKEVCRQHLDAWLSSLRAQTPGIDDPRTRLEEVSLVGLRNLFALLLASTPEPPDSPLDALEAAGGLSHMELYRQHLVLPLRGSPYEVATAIKLGPPTGELFALQERLLTELDDEGQEVLVTLGQLF